MVANDYQLITSVAIRTVDNLICEEDADAAGQAKDFLAKYPDLSKGRPLGPVPTEKEMGATSPGDTRILRGVRVLGKYYLFLWDTYQQSDRTSHSYLGYRFVSPGGVIIFQGTDFGVPRITAIDSDEVVYELLGWFIEEVDDDQLTPEQQEFKDSDDAYDIRSFISDRSYRAQPDAPAPPPIIRDLPGYEHGEEEE